MTICRYYPRFWRVTITVASKNRRVWRRACVIACLLQPGLHIISTCKDGRLKIISYKTSRHHVLQIFMSNHLSNPKNVILCYINLTFI